MSPLQFDHRRCACLDGVWDFFPGDHQLADLDGLVAQPIEVPALWETQGHLDLDGAAWYRRRFHLEDASGGWTLRFGAVMDLTEVFLNGARIGGHAQAFTPFELDVAPALVTGENVLAVRVLDPSLHDAEHPRTAHGKQGWMNHLFPSRPSLYLTYGGIWQPVTLRRHGTVVVGGVFVSSDPDDLVVSAELENRGAAAVARLSVRTLGLARVEEVELAAGGRAVVRLGLGPTGAARWRPEAPALHHLSADVATTSTSSTPPRPAGPPPTDRCSSPSSATGGCPRCRCSPSRPSGTSGAPMPAAWPTRCGRRRSTGSPSRPSATRGCPTACRPRCSAATTTSAATASPSSPSSPTSRSS